MSSTGSMVGVGKAYQNLGWRAADQQEKLVGCAQEFYLHGGNWLLVSSSGA